MKKDISLEPIYTDFQKKASKILYDMHGNGWWVLDIHTINALDYERKLGRPKKIVKAKI